MINQRSVAGVFPDTPATPDQINPVVAGSTRNVTSDAQAFLFYSGGLNAAGDFSPVGRPSLLVVTTPPNKTGCR